MATMVSIETIPTHRPRNSSVWSTTELSEPNVTDTYL